MARVLIAAWPLAGHVYPCLAIARELARRGHDVAFYTGSSMRGTLEAEEGFRVFPLARVDESRFDRGFASRQQKMSWTRPFGFVAFLQEWLGNTLGAAALDLEEILASWKPELILAEESMWAPSLILREKHDVAVVVCSVIAGCLLPGRDVPLPGIGLRPPKTGTARLSQATIRTAAALLAQGLRAGVNRTRHANGLPPLRTSIREAVGNVPLYLVRGSPELDYERGDLPASVAYVGPLDHTDAHPDPSSAWIGDLPRDRPVVFASEGTMHAGRPVVLKAAADGLGGLNVQLIMATGRRRSPGDLGLGPLPANVTVHQWVPQRELFARTDVVITVGGCGTVLGALAAGVPLLVLPAESDQPENARHVVEAGAGLSMPRRRCTAARVRRAVERLLSERAFRDNARRIAASFERYRGTRRAGDLIEQQLTGTHHEIATGIGSQEVLH